MSYFVLKNNLQLSQVLIFTVLDVELKYKHMVIYDSLYKTDAKIRLKITDIFNIRL